MKYLVLAYGDGKEWDALTTEQQSELLKADEVLRRRGDAVGAVQPDQVTVVKAWDGTPHVTGGAFAQSAVPLAGFGVIEANSVEEVIELVKDTPCARVGGAVEIRPLL